MTTQTTAQTIQNPKSPTEAPATPQMSDRDRLEDMLSTEKRLTANFNTFAFETSHKQLQQDVMTILNETHQSQFEMFELMFRKGHYKLDAEQQMKLDQAFQQYNGYTNQFPYPNTAMQ